jgi:hypothetical protein
MRNTIASGLDKGNDMLAVLSGFRPLSRLHPRPQAKDFAPRSPSSQERQGEEFKWPSFVSCGLNRPQLHSPFPLGALGVLARRSAWIRITIPRFLICVICVTRFLRERVMPRYSEASGVFFKSARCFGVPRHDERTRFELGCGRSPLWENSCRFAPIRGSPSGDATRRGEERVSRKRSFCCMPGLPLRMMRKFSAGFSGDVRSL